MVYRSFEKIKNKEIISRPKLRCLSRICLIVVSTFLLIVVALVSGWFKYFAVVVGSSSMEHTINKGDVVIVKKFQKNETDNLRIEDILVFKQSKKILIYRIIKIENIQGEKHFYTKGDSNETEDSLAVTQESIIGTTWFKIRFIGWPTVWLGELINK